MISSERAASDRADHGVNAGQALLLHICCAPCSTHVIDILRKDFRITAFFYNPNIYPSREYERRLVEVQRFCRRLEISLLPAEYDAQDWNRRMRGRSGDHEGGPHCSVCFWIRLWRTAREARRHNFELFATTLSISPHKDVGTINRMGQRAARKAGVRFWPADFKKGDGFGRSCRLAREYDLYRQDYCGCADSLREREERKASRPNLNGNKARREK
jgi:predicted adenine nucleotide alpha hydrolase (AANH) superfamily ATPase